jgi:hypothetical protein
VIFFSSDLDYWSTAIRNPAKPFSLGCVQNSPMVLNNAGDPLICYIFREVGRSLGEYVGALLPSISKVIKLPITHKKISHIKLIVLFLQDLLGDPNELPVICVGAVWKSFCLMEGGFLERMNTQPGPIKSLHSLESFTLLQLQLSLSVGAILKKKTIKYHSYILSKSFGSNCHSILIRERWFKVC